MSQSTKDAIKSIPLMGRSSEQIIETLAFTKATAEFLDKCQPGVGNVLKNLKKESDCDPDFVGFARLPNGTALRIEGVKKESKNGVPMLSLKVVEIPENIYRSRTSFKAEVPDYNEKKRDFFG